MKKLVISAAAALATSFASMSAHAIVLDFVAEAAGAERGITNGSTITNFQGTGIDVTFTAGDSPDYFPYFDDLSSGRPGGLGVCKNLASGVGGEGDDGASDDCAPSNDDNVSVSESIGLSFSDGFNLNRISFNDAAHNPLGVAGNGGNVYVDTGSGFVQFTFAEVIASAIAGDFANVDTITFRFLDTQFYISSVADVPIPGAIPLLLSGLAGLGFASRRKKA